MQEEVGKCSHGAELLLVLTFKKKIFKIVSELDAFNNERKDLETNLLNKIKSSISDKVSDSVIVLTGNNWHEGIIGIIASRIKDKYNKPTVIISINNDIGKASARSITGFDIGKTIISAVQDKILIKGGGHKMAGGFTINVNQIESFKSFINKKFQTINIDINNQKKLFIDSVISPSALNIDFYEKVENLSPFGTGNPEPKFSIENLKSVNSSIVGEKHVKSVLLGPDGSSIKTIAFNAVENDIGAYLMKKIGQNI